MKTTKMVWVVCALLFLSCGAFSRAAVVKYRFLGEVTSVGSVLTSEFSVGDQVIGYYSFDDSVPDSVPDPDVGSYEDHFTESVIEFESGYSATLDPADTIDFTLLDNAFPLGGDLYEVTYAVLGAEVNAYDVEQFALELIDDDGVMLASDALPDSAPNVSLAESATGYLRFEREYFVEFNVLSLQQVPEPSSIVLGVGLALAAIAWRNRH